MKVSVILPDNDALRFEQYCKSKGFKKSTLIVRLIREHIEKEGLNFHEVIIKNEQKTANVNDSK